MTNLAPKGLSSYTTPGDTTDITADAGQNNLFGLGLQARSNAGVGKAADEKNPDHCPERETDMPSHDFMLSNQRPTIVLSPAYSP